MILSVRVLWSGEESLDFSNNAGKGQSSALSLRIHIPGLRPAAKCLVYGTYGNIQHLEHATAGAPRKSDLIHFINQIFVLVLCDKTCHDRCYPHHIPDASNTPLPMTMPPFESADIVYSPTSASSGTMLRLRRFSQGRK